MLDSVHPYASFWLDVIDRAAKVGAVFVAGYWAYWNHIKKRTFKERLQPTIEISRLREKPSIFAVDIKAVNIGNALIQLQEVRVCRILYLDAKLVELRVDTFDVLKDEDIIEPGENISGQLLFAGEPPVDASILKAEFILFAGKNYRWRAEKVILLERGQIDDNSTRENDL